jgi:hypothetical protein
MAILYPGISITLEVYNIAILLLVRVSFSSSPIALGLGRYDQSRHGVGKFLEEQWMKADTPSTILVSQRQFSFFRRTFKANRNKMA